MGQKIGEYEHVDYWRKLMREEAKAGGSESRKWRRTATDEREADWYDQMNRYRTREIVGYMGQAERPSLTQCVSCGSEIESLEHAFVKRQEWDADGSGPYNFYLCGQCSGKG